MSDSTLYFIRRESDGAIKIGITSNLARRVADLQRQHGTLRVIGVVDGGAGTHEKLPHLIFSGRRLDGEFFQESQALSEFREKYSSPPPTLPEPAQTGAGWKRSKNRPWIDLYSDPLAVYDRDQFVRDYERWIEQGLIALSKHKYLPIFRGFPSKTVFVPQPGPRNWGWTPLNPHCWTDTNGRRLHHG